MPAEGVFGNQTAAQAAAFSAAVAAAPAPASSGGSAPVVAPQPAVQPSAVPTEKVTISYKGGDRMDVMNVDLGYWQTQGWSVVGPATTTGIPMEKGPADITGEQPMIPATGVAQPKMATLINPNTKERKAIVIGSPEEKSLYGLGFELETSPGVGVKAGRIISPTNLPMMTLVNPTTGDKEVVQDGSTKATQLKSEGYVLDSVARNFTADAISRNLPDPSAVFAELGTQGQSSVDIITGIADTISASIQTAVDKMGKQLELVRAQREKAESERAAAKETIEGAYAGTSREDIVRGEMERLKIEETQAKLDSVLKDIADAKGSLNLGLIREQQGLRPMGIIGRRMDVMQQQASALIGSLAAEAELYQGKIDNAYKIMSLTTSAMTQDLEDRREMYNFLFDLADKEVIVLKSEEKELAKQNLAALTDMQERLDKNNEKIMDIIVKNPEAAQYGKVTLLDTPESATAKMLPYIATLSARARAIEEERTMAQNLTITESTDAAGNVTQTATNKLTGGLVYQRSLGPIGKPTASGGSGGRIESTMVERESTRQKNTAAELHGQLRGVIGDDGFVSPNDYRVAKGIWVEDGFNAKDFDIIFASYRNPKNKYYSITY